MVRVDHGTEFDLVLFIQQLLKDHRGNPYCEPYLQTQSCHVSQFFLNAQFPGQGQGGTTIHENPQEARVKSPPSEIFLDEGTGNDDGVKFIFLFVCLFYDNLP